MRNRMQEELDLTPAADRENRPIFDQAASELEKIRSETSTQVQQVIAETDRALAPELTDEQRAKLEQLEKCSGQRGLRNSEAHGAGKPGRNDTF